MLRKEKREIFRTISQRRSFNEWNDFKASEFQRYNETERLILYFRLHLGILNRKEISKRTGIPEYKIEKFVKAIRTGSKTHESKTLMNTGSILRQMIITELAGRIERNLRDTKLHRI